MILFKINWSFWLPLFFLCPLEHIWYSKLKKVIMTLNTEANHTVYSTPPLLSVQFFILFHILWAFSQAHLWLSDICLIQMLARGPLVITFLSPKLQHLFLPPPRSISCCGSEFLGKDVEQLCNRFDAEVFHFQLFCVENCHRLFKPAPAPAPAAEHFPPIPPVLGGKNWKNIKPMICSYTYIVTIKKIPNVWTLSGELKL